MQSKIKVVNESKTDIRLFKVKNNDVSLSQLLKDLTQFAKQAFNLNCDFSFQFEDDEGDFITIESDNDLKEAFETKKTTKLFVKTKKNTMNTNEINQTFEEGEMDEIDYKENDDVVNTNEKLTSNNDSNDNNNLKEYKEFLEELATNNELKDEFGSFLLTFYLSFKESNYQEIKKSFLSSLNASDKLKNHKIMNKFKNEFLDKLVNDKRLLWEISHLHEETIEWYYEELINHIKYNSDKIDKKIKEKMDQKYQHIPPFLFPFVEFFMPDFDPRKYGPRHHHSGRGRGRGHGRGHHRGRGRGFHHPPPPHHFEDFGYYGHPPPHHHEFYGHPPPPPHHHHRGRGRGRGRGHHRGRGRGFHHPPPHHWGHHPLHHWEEHNLRVDIVEDNISLADNAVVAPNMVLIKTWKLKNVGEPIPPNCKLQYHGRRQNEMITQKEFFLKNNKIDKNSEFNVSVEVKSPNLSGKYCSKWKLIAPNGKRFGQPLFVKFEVFDEEDRFIEESLDELIDDINIQQNENINSGNDNFNNDNNNNQDVIISNKITQEGDQNDNTYNDKINDKKKELELKKQELLNKIEKLQNETQNLNNVPNFGERTVSQSVEPDEDNNSNKD